MRLEGWDLEVIMIGKVFMEWSLAIQIKGRSSSHISSITILHRTTELNIHAIASPSVGKYNHFYARGWWHEHTSRYDLRNTIKVDSIARQAPELDGTDMRDTEEYEPYRKHAMRSVEE
jgi:hypothetical protein